ncbi:MAG TPA: hypothetical protein VF434_08610, partial [Promineifilum sp.]
TTFQFVPVVLVGGIAGLIWLLFHDRLSAFLLGGTFALYLFVAATYRAPQTVEYMIPAYIVGAMITGNATRFLPDRIPSVQFAGGVAIALVSIVIVGALSQFERNITASGARHEAIDARDTAGRLLSEAPPNSTILAHWHWATPLWYLQEVEGARPDLDVRFVFPDGDSYALTWERRAKEAFAAGRPVITTWVPASPIDDLPVPEPIGEGQLYPQTTRSSLPEDFIQANQLSGEEVEVLGYELDQPTMVTPGEEFVITVAWRPGAGFQDPSGLFVHLTGPDGVIYGQDDRPAHSSGAVTLTEFRVTPRPETPVGELTVQFGVAADADQRVPLTKVSVRPSRTSLVTRNPVNRLLLDGSNQRLIGYDWDHTLTDRSRLYLHWQSDDGTYSTQVIDDEAIETPELPAYRGPWGVPVTRWEFPRGRDGGHYVPLGQGIVWMGETLNGLVLNPGQSLVVDQELRSSRPINRDHVVSVRLIGLEPESDQWAWWDLQDSIPAMGAIPTLKWIRGSFVRSPHRLTVNEAAPPEQELTGALTLYDAFTNRPLPILDDRIRDVNPWIPLCIARVGE